MAPSKYLMVLPVPAHRVDECHFLVESAFAEHLRLLKQSLGDLAQDLVVLGPALPPSAALNQTSLTRIDEAGEGIRFIPAFPAHIGRLGYLKLFPKVFRTLQREVRTATVVHSGYSMLYRPFEIVSLILAWINGKATVSVSDIDHRNSAFMQLQTGRWTYKEYLVTKWVHYRYIHLQHLLISRMASVMLLKGRAFAHDYGRARSNVHFFLDSAFSARHIIPRAQLSAKLTRLSDSDSHIEIGYYGRLVAYKGIDHMLQALRRLRDMGFDKFRFTIVGSGEQEQLLRDLTRQLGLEDFVAFHPAIPYGKQLFIKLYDFDILLAAPLSEDTPRSALDAAACAQVIAAYDTYYYQDLAELGAAVTTAAWASTDALANALYELCTDRRWLMQAMHQAVSFAQSNTQEVWLERRTEWTRRAVEG